MDSLGMSILIPAFGSIAVFLIIVSAPVLLHDMGTLAFGLTESNTEKAIQDLYLSNVSARQITVVAWVSAVIIGLLCYLITTSVVVSLFIFAIVPVAPRVLFRYLAKVRLQEFDERLPAALDQLTSSSKAGLSLPQALEEVSNSAPKPVSEEFSSIVHEHVLGTDLEQALKNARDRIGSKSFALVVSALIVNMEKGGNLPEALQRISESLKEVWRLEQKLITSSAEGRKAMFVISAVPVFVFFLVMILQPDIANTLTSTGYGIVILIAALFLYATGIFWLRSILGKEV